jgi:hypothetical protein
MISVQLIGELAEFSMLIEILNDARVAGAGIALDVLGVEGLGEVLKSRIDRIKGDLK